MHPELPPQPRPDPATLARAQARLLAGLSAIQGTEPTEASDASQGGAAPDPEATSLQVSWLGPQGAWEAGRHEEPPATARYRFGAVFARGGLGSVRRAEDRKLGRTVAVKELLRFDDRAIDRFVREAAITARLQHPGIVPLYDLGRDAEGRPFLCMKLVEGASLEQKIADCADLGVRLGLLPHVIAAADAIAYAHRQGVIHRDLKPANILVGEFGEVVVIDWGLAKDLSQGADAAPAPGDDPGTVSDLTAAGSLLGTLRYMPPEQARGERVDARSDIYALGAALYHVLAGAPPFHDRRAAQLVRDVIEGRPRPLAELVPGVPPALAAIVDKAMSPETDRRYAAAEAFAEDLRRFQAGLLVGAHAYSLAEIGRLWLRRHRAVSAVAAASLVALGVVGALSFGRIRAARDVAEDQRAAAEVAQVVAQQRADEAEEARRVADRRADDLLLAQARLALEVDPTRVPGILAQVGPDPTRDGALRALATAAHAQLDVSAWMTGPHSRIDGGLRLADGTWLVSTPDALWRWRPGEVAGENIGEGGRLVATADRTTWAAIRAVTNREAAIQVHRGGGEPERLTVQLERGAAWYRWQLRPDGKVLFGGAVLQVPSVEIDLATGQVTTFSDAGAPPAVAAARELQSRADGRLFAGVRDGRTLVVWDRESGAVETTRLPGIARGFGGGWTADGGAFVVSCPKDQKRGDDREADRVLVWRPDAPSRTVEATFVAPARGAVVFIAERDGRMSAWAEDLDGARLWTRDVHTDRSDDFVVMPMTSRDGDMVLWSFGDALDVVDVASGTLLHAQRRSLREVPVIDAGALLLPRPGGLARVEPARTAWRTTWPAPASGRANIRWSPDRRWAVRQADDRVVRVDTGSGGQEELPAGCGPWQATRALAEVAGDGRALVVDLRGGGCLWGHGRTDILDTPPHPLIGSSFAPDGSRFALGFADGNLLEWTDPAATPRALPEIGMHDFLQYAPDSSVLIAHESGGALSAVGRDGRVRTLVEAPPANPRRLAGAAVGLAPAGATVALYRRDEPEIVVVDVASSARTRLSGAVRGDLDQVAPALRYSPSGQTLAVLDNEVLQVWSLARPDAPARVSGVPGFDLAFLDERTVVVLREDGGLELVDPPSGTHAPLRGGTAGREFPSLVAMPGGLALKTRTGEVLRFTDLLPPAGAPMRDWLKRQVVP